MMYTYPYVRIDTYMPLRMYVYNKPYLCGIHLGINYILPPSPVKIYFIEANSYRILLLKYEILFTIKCIYMENIDLGVCVGGLGCCVPRKICVCISYKFGISVELNFLDDLDVCLCQCCCCWYYITEFGERIF